MQTASVVLGLPVQEDPVLNLIGLLTVMDSEIVPVLLELESSGVAALAASSTTALKL
jgi:hypothetical protein